YCQITMKIKLLAICGLSAALSISTFAASKDWGVADGLATIGGTNNPLVGFTFEVGSFGSFVPTLDNASSWGANFSTTGLAVSTPATWLAPFPDVAPT